jgi:hypothetical protein
MDFRENYIRRLRDEIARYKADIRPFQAGEMQIRVRVASGEWLDITPQRIAETRKWIEVNESIIATLEAGEPV